MLQTILEWADAQSAANGGLYVMANSDYGVDASRARAFGAKGVGLCRTEHTFFEADRLPIVQEMVMCTDKAERQKCLDKLLPFQRKTFEELFVSMTGYVCVVVFCRMMSR